MALSVEQAKLVKEASVQLSALTTEIKNKALQNIADALMANLPAIVEANKQDIAISQANNLAAPLLKRLLFDEKKIKATVEGIESLIHLPDPVGVTLSATEL
ncbi:MAG: hypothetical protein ACP5PS_10940, partial [Bacteroidales bacterium]